MQHGAPHKRLWTLVACIFVLTITLMVALPSTPQNGLLWDFMMALGYVATALLLIIPFISTRFWYSLGGQAHAAPRLLGAHRLITYIALIYVMIHVVGLIIIDTTVIEYLKPSAPWGMLAALAATVLLVITLVHSEFRIELKAGYKNWRIWHSVLSTLIVAGVFYHIVEASYFVNSAALKLVLTVLAVISGVLIFTQSRDYQPLRSTHKTGAGGAIPIWRIIGYASLFASLVLFIFTIPRVGNRDELQALQCLLGAC